MKPSIRKYLVLTTAIAVSLISLLWSWNTLAPLFHAPPAEFRHAIAAALLLLTLRALFRARPGTGVWRHEP